MSYFKNIAKVVKANRKAKGFSQEVLSNEIGNKNGQFISNVERALCSIPKKSLNKMSEVLEVPVETFIDAMTKDHKTTLINATMPSFGNKMLSKNF